MKNLRNYLIQYVSIHLVNLKITVYEGRCRKVNSLRLQYPRKFLNNHIFLPHLNEIMRIKG